MARRLSKLEAGVWPDLVGQLLVQEPTGVWDPATTWSWFEAEAKIRKQFPNITIQVLPEGTTIRKEFSPDRVQIFVDGGGKVVKPPTIG